MILFKITYNLRQGKDVKTFNAGILAQSKEKATDYLYRKVGGNARIDSISVQGNVHAIDDEIIDAIVNNSEKVKEDKKRFKDLNSKIKAYEDELAELRNELEDSRKGNSQVSKEIQEELEKASKVYLCPYCGYETESMKGMKTHIGKMHNVKQIKNEENIEK